MDKKLLNKSINNLLNNCAELDKNDSLLIISEDPKFGWYDKEISVAVYNYAEISLSYQPNFGSSEIINKESFLSNSAQLLRRLLILLFSSFLSIVT
jgi:hypothetical protein